MAIIRFYNPVLSAYRDENYNEAYERFLNHFSSAENCGCYQGNMPAANIHEGEKEFLIELALPGVNKNDIRIKHENELLTVSVEKPAGENEAESYTRQEFNYAGAIRTFKTGDKVDAGQITAKLENGILSLRLPKKEAYVKKPAQAIVVE